MKIIKFISVMLVLCTICLSGCTIGKTTTTTTTTTTTAKKDDPPKADGELNEMFEIIEKDAESNSKIDFWIEYEELHFELKNSGLYDEDNESIASDLGLEEYEYYVSYFSPYIEIVFDDLNEYEDCRNDIVEAINDNSNMVLSANSCALIESNNTEATVDEEGYDTHYPLSDAFDDIGVSSSTYTGNGVKVGILDGGIPSITANFKDGYYTAINGSPDLHSAVIGSIIGGTSGIAENVHFYCMSKSNSIINDCNLLIYTYGVNIINVSLWYANLGYYCNYDACIDNIVSNSGCTFVKSAGNRGQAIYNHDRLVTAPGNAMNAITVGAINYDNNVSYFSSWVVSDDFLYKPDVVAPGQLLYNIPNISGAKSGTSYAAPMVVGTIALLMEEFSVLKTNPALVKSVLHVGGYKLPSQSDYFDEQAGFGLINYDRMRTCLLNSMHSDFTISSTALQGDIVSSTQVTVPYYAQIAINANSLVNSSNITTNNDSTTPEYTDYSIKIYDISTSAYVSNSDIDSSVDYLVFTNNSSTNDQYRIDIVLEEDNNTGSAEVGSIAYRNIPHYHAYNLRYSPFNSLQHKRYCRCGAYTLQSHVYTQWKYSDQTYHIEKCICGTTGTATALHVLRKGDAAIGGCKPCIICGGLIDIEDGFGQIIYQISKFSINGSYILPNGIIVLVDEDIEAYFNGTLVFYDRDELPETE